MAARKELLAASDEIIEDAVKYADPMVLRGLLYQLTGDESLADIRVGPGMAGFVEVRGLADPADIPRLQAKAASFLKSYRDSGAADIALGPPERLRKSFSLAAGEEVPEAEFDMWFEQSALDPWARSFKWEQRPPTDRLQKFRVAVIGAGMGGLSAGAQLARAGIPYFVLEKNDDVGGTWYENRYPGARVDSPSRTYTHVFGFDFGYPNPFCLRGENLRYLNWIADHFGVRENITFNTEVRSLTWDHEASFWVIRADGPGGSQEWRADAVISAVGFLSRPSLPRFEGMEDFQGTSFHTARWPEDLDLTGKRVALVGTGASGIQLAPELVKLAAHTYIFQRNPSWCFDTPGYLDPFPAQVGWLDRNFPYFTNFTRLRVSWFSAPAKVAQAQRIDPAFTDPDTRSPHNKRVRDERVAFVKRKLASRPELIDKMIPGAPPLSSRHVLIDPNNSIFDALLRDDVTLVSDTIRRIKQHEIEVEDGTSYPVDVIVYATGFRANDFLWPMEIRGEGGRSVEELWAPDGARAYLGTMLPGFPNFFMIYGPNTNNWGGLQIVDFEELTTRFALSCIAGLIRDGKRTVDVTYDAYRRYNAHVDHSESRMMYTDPRARNYYRNAQGRSAANNPIDVRRIWTWLREPAKPDQTGGAHELEPEGLPALHPHFGADLVVG
jgi:4-hydroxyacetophenone monooxygenase